MEDLAGKTKIQQDFGEKDRRQAVLNDIDFSLHKKRTVRKILESKSEMGDSTSFIVPNMNKDLKEIVMEELKNDDNIIAVLSCISCGCALAGNEETFLQIPDSESYVLYFRCAILITSIASVIWLVRRYQMLLLLKVLTYTVGVKDTLFSTGLYKGLMLEIFIHSIFSPPGIDYIFTINTLGYTIHYSLDDYFTICNLFRLYTLLRLFGHYSKYTQKTAEIVCERNGETADAIFALKSFLKDSPFLGIGIVFMSLSLFCAIILRIFERPDRTPYNSTPGPSTLGTLADNLWVIFFTTTTVGYGNIYPTTHMGRATCIFACIFGNMFLGMLVVAINQKMDHSDNENLAYSWIYRNNVKKSIKNYAVKSIRLAAKLYLLSKNKWKCHCISKIKPNSSVEIGEVKVLFDLRYLSKDQYLKKCQLYRELKFNLEKISDITDDARNIGRKDLENIKLIEDTVRVDTTHIFNKIQKMITKETLLINSQTSLSQHKIEKKLSEIKENANQMRKLMRSALRRQTTLEESPAYSHRGQGNSEHFG